MGEDNHQDTLPPVGIADKTQPTEKFRAIKEKGWWYILDTEVGKKVGTRKNGELKVLRKKTSSGIAEIIFNLRKNYEESMQMQEEKNTCA